MRTLLISIFLYSYYSLCFCQGINIDFTASTTGGCSPLTVVFTPSIIDASFSYNWDFGNGITSTDIEPSVIYTQPGLYSVVLTVIDSANIPSSVAHQGMINVAGNAPVVNFTTSNQRGCETPHTTTFTSFITPPSSMYAYYWEFGDGGVSTQENPTHTFQQGGDYTIRLTVSDLSGGCQSSRVKPDFVQVKIPNANFAVSDTNTCVGSSISFANISPSVNHYWDFGDGTSATTPNPTHAYASVGDYDISLIVTSTAIFGNCADTIVKPLYMHVDASPDVNMATFPILPVEQCEPPVFVNFFDISNGAIDWQWNFGDGTISSFPFASHIYTEPGEYDVTLTITSPNGCEASEIFYGAVKIADLGLDMEVDVNEGCVPLNVTFTNESAPVGGNVSFFEWDFGDGSSTNITSPQPHVYAQQGKYTVKLLGVMENGCRDTLILDDFIGTGAPPAAAFFAEDGTQDTIFANINDNIQFWDASQGVDSTSFWEWQWGNGEQDEWEDDPMYAYDEPGTYDVTMIVSNNGCNDTVTRDNYIVIDSECGKDAFEPNDDFWNAKEIPPLGIFQSAQICDGGDEDWFFFDVGQHNNVKVVLGGMRVNLNLKVYDLNLNLLEFSDEPETEREIIVLNNLPTGGRFYVKVYGDLGAYDGEGYILRLNKRSTPFAQPGSGIRTEEELNTTFEDWQSFSLYPNPVQITVTLSFGLAFEEEVMVRIWDMKGNLILREYNQGIEGENQLTLNLAQLPVGLYTVELVSSSANYQQKIQVVE